LSSYIIPEEQKKQSISKLKSDSIVNIDPSSCLVKDSDSLMFYDIVMIHLIRGQIMTH